MSLSIYKLSEEAKDLSRKDNLIHVFNGKYTWIQQFLLLRNAYKGRGKCMCVCCSIICDIKKLEIALPAVAPLGGASYCIHQRVAGWIPSQSTHTQAAVQSLVRAGMGGK